MMTRFSLLAGAMLAMVAFTHPAAADPTDQEVVVSRAVSTLERLSSDNHFANHMGERMERAKALLIVPSLVKAGFIFGGEYGNGVLLVRGDDGQWSSPAFYTITSGSIGLQAGIQDSSVLFAIMSEAGLKAIMDNAFKVGAEIGVAVLTAGATAEASTTGNLGADIFAFSHNVGAFGGGALEGAVIKPRPSWNAAYYQREVTAEDIVLAHAVANPHADKLRNALAR